MLHKTNNTELPNNIGCVCFDIMFTNIPAYTSQIFVFFPDRQCVRAPNFIIKFMHTTYSTFGEASPCRFQLCSARWLCICVWFKGFLFNYKMVAKFGLQRLNAYLIYDVVWLAKTKDASFVFWYIKVSSSLLFIGLLNVKHLIMDRKFRKYTSFDRNWLNFSVRTSQFKITRHSSEIYMFTNWKDKTSFEDQSQSSG